MNTPTATATLALLLLAPTFACDVQGEDPVAGDLVDLRIDDDGPSSWEVEKLAEPDAALLVDHAAGLGFALAEFSFAYPVDGIALAELEGPTEQPAFLSFDIDDEGTTRVTMLVVVADSGEAQVYRVVDGEVVLAPTGAVELGIEAPEMPVETECVSWHRCNCLEFAATVGVCAANGMYTPAFYDCIRFFCE